MSRPRRRNRNEHGAVAKPATQPQQLVTAANGRWRTIVRYGAVFACGAALAAAGLILPERLSSKPTKPAYAGVVNPKLDYERPWRSGALPTSHYDLLKMTPLNEELESRGIPLKATGGPGNSAQDWADYLTDNGPGVQADVLESILSASKRIDDQFGTNLTESTWLSILTGKFDAVP